MKEIFDKIQDDIKVIKATELISRQFKELRDYLSSQSIEPISSFNQIKRNDRFKGLISETMFFDNKFIYDIVIGVENMDVNIIMLEHVSKFQLTTIPNYSKSKNEKGEVIEKVDFTTRLVIAYQDSGQLYYDIPPEKSTNILQLIGVLTKHIK